MVIKVSTGVMPEIGKYYVFLYNSKLIIGKCIINPSPKARYTWAMEGVNDSKVYYPYGSDILQLDDKVQSVKAITTFEFNDIYGF